MQQAGLNQAKARIVVQRVELVDGMLKVRHKALMPAFCRAASIGRSGCKVVSSLLQISTLSRNTVLGDFPPSISD